MGITVRGTVAQTSSKKVRGGSTIYSFKLDSGTWYGTDFEQADISEGDIVEFESQDGGKYGPKVDPKSVKVVGKGDPVQAKQGAAEGKAKSDYVGFPVPKDASGRAINYQNALGNAVTLFVGMSNGMGIDSKQAADEVLEIAKKFAAFTTGDAE